MSRISQESLEKLQECVVGRGGVGVGFKVVEWWVFCLKY